MPQLTYYASNFPVSYGPFLTGQHSLAFTWADLLWAAISVGRAELLHLVRYGSFSYFEIVYRAAIIFANLCETPNGTIRRSAAYEGLDPSEKGAISYFIGLTVTKLFTALRLDIPWLMHLDVYRRQLRPVLFGSNRPDLVGRNVAGDWIVVESKGRTHGYDQRALDRAKVQAGQVRSISGTQPALRLAMLAHFHNGLLECAVDDPYDEGPQKTPIDLPLSGGDLLKGYYRPLLEWVREAPEIRREVVEQRSFRVADLPEIDVSVGLHESLFHEDFVDDITSTHFGRSGEMAADARRSVGIDGIIVETGELWSGENMVREPQERRRAR